MENIEKPIYQSLEDSVKHAWREIYNKCMGKD